MSAQFKTENAALETEICEAAPYLAGDLGFLRAWESNDFAEIGRRLHLVIMAHRVATQEKIA